MQCMCKLLTCDVFAGDQTARPTSGGRTTRHSSGTPQYHAPPVAPLSGSQTARASLESGASDALLHRRPASSRRASLPPEAAVAACMRPRSSGSDRTRVYSSRSSGGGTARPALLGSGSVEGSASVLAPTLSRQDSLGLHMPMEVCPKLNDMTSEKRLEDGLEGSRSRLDALHTHTSLPSTCEQRSSSGAAGGSSRALADSTNSPSRPRRERSGSRTSRVRGESAGRHSRENRMDFVGMGKADKELNLAAKREMSVLEQVCALRGQPRLSRVMPAGSHGFDWLGLAVRNASS
jgi:hypothetical protein